MAQETTSTYLRISGVFGEEKIAEAFLKDMKKKNWWNCANGQGIFRKGRVVSVVTDNANSRDLFRQFLELAQATIRL